MYLDVGTLSVVTVFVTALLGVLLVFAGLQNRSIRAPMWWGAAQIVGATGLALVTSHGTVPDFVSVDIGNALVLLAYGMIWAGARMFDGRKVSPLVVVFAPILWLLVCRLPAFAEDINLRVVVGVGDDGDAGGGDRRRVLARPRRAADVALADDHRAAGLCGRAARAHPGDLFRAHPGQHR